MHICFVEGYYLNGGAGTFIKNYGEQLIKLGHNVSVVCADTGGELKYFKDGSISVYPIMEIAPNRIIYYTSRFPVLKLFSKLFFYLFNGLKIYLFLLKLNRLNKIDFIEYSEGGDFWNTLLRTFKYSVHLHGSYYTFKVQSGISTDKADWIRRYVEHLFIRRANLVFSPSKAMVRYVENEMKKKLNNVFTIPYPVHNYNRNRFIHLDYSYKRDNAILLFASRNDHLKGGELFINALKCIPKNIIDKISVEIYGYSPKQDISKMEYIKLNNFIDRKTLMEKYLDADICVIPSIFDNSPNTVYEAMINGKIVVASSVGGIPEILGSSENGYLFNPLDLNDFSKKLILAIRLVLNGNSNPMRENAVNRISSISNIEKNTKQRLLLINK